MRMFAIRSISASSDNWLWTCKFSMFVHLFQETWLFHCPLQYGKGTINSVRHFSHLSLLTLLPPSPFAILRYTFKEHVSRHRCKITFVGRGVSRLESHSPVCQLTVSSKGKSSLEPAWAASAGQCWSKRRRYVDFLLLFFCIASLSSYLFLFYLLFGRGGSRVFFQGLFYFWALEGS